MRNTTILRNKYYFLFKEKMYQSHVKSYNMAERNFPEDVTFEVVFVSRSGYY